MGQLLERRRTPLPQLSKGAVYSGGGGWGAGPEAFLTVGDLVSLSLQTTSLPVGEMVPVPGHLALPGLLLSEGLVTPMSSKGVEERPGSSPWPRHMARSLLDQLRFTCVRTWTCAWEGSEQLATPWSHDRAGPGVGEGGARTAY